jgi:hypothetical protein
MTVSNTNNKESKTMRKTLARHSSGIKLQYDTNNNQWIMTGGKYGQHSIYEPPVFNDRVYAHWLGYLINNGINKFEKEMWPTITKEKYNQLNDSNNQ